MDTKYYGDMTTGYTATFYGKEDKFKYQIHKVRAACKIAGSTPCKILEHESWGFTSQEAAENDAFSWLVNNRNVKQRV